MAVLIVGAIMLLNEGISLGLLYVAGILLGFATGSANVPIGASVKEAFGNKEFNEKIGTVAAFNFFGVSIGPVILSSFYDIYGSFHIGVYVIIAIAAVAGVLMFAATRRVGSGT